jgi:hypothetical protein
MLVEMVGARPTRSGRRRRTAAAGAALSVLALAGCSWGDDEDEPAEVAEPATTEPGTQRLGPDGRWLVTVEQWGGVRLQNRDRIAESVARTLDEYVEGAFGGKYPRADFDSAFAVWTEDAARLGKQDAEITTNSALGEALVDVAADSLQAELFVFAPGETPGGASAHVVMRFIGEQAGGDRVTITVKGELRLTRDGDRWRIFGYDLEHGVQAR